MPKTIKINIIADPLLSSKIIRDYLLTKTPDYLINIGNYIREDIEINSQNIIRSIWITPVRGNNLYLTRTLTDSFGAIILFDKENRLSFEAAKAHYHEYRKIVSSYPPIILLGINSESETVTTEEGVKLAKELNVSYYEMFADEIQVFRNVLEEYSLLILRTNK